MRAQETKSKRERRGRATPHIRTPRELRPRNSSANNTACVENKTEPSERVRGRQRRRRKDIKMIRSSSRSFAKAFSFPAAALRVRCRASSAPQPRPKLSCRSGKRQPLLPMRDTRSVTSTRRHFLLDKTRKEETMFSPRLVFLSSSESTRTPSHLCLWFSSSTGRVCVTAHIRDPDNSLTEKSIIIVVVVINTINIKIVSFPCIYVLKGESRPGTASAAATLQEMLRQTIQLPLEKISSNAPPFFAQRATKRAKRVAEYAHT